MGMYLCSTLTPSLALQTIDPLQQAVIRSAAGVHSLPEVAATAARVYPLLIATASLGGVAGMHAWTCAVWSGSHGHVHSRLTSGYVTGHSFATSVPTALCSCW